MPWSLHFMQNWFIVHWSNFKSWLRLPCVNIDYTLWIQLERQIYNAKINDFTCWRYILGYVLWGGELLICYIIAVLVGWLMIRWPILLYIYIKLCLYFQLFHCSCMLTEILLIICIWVHTFNVSRATKFRPWPGFDSTFYLNSYAHIWHCFVPWLKLQT